MEQDGWMTYMSISHSLIEQSTLPPPLLIYPTTTEIQWEIQIQMLIEISFHGSTSTYVINHN